MIFIHGGGVERLLDISMEWMILGCNGPYPEAGGACSSYLLRAEGRNLLIDAGSGALARLQEHVSIEELNAVLLSHLHFDHMGEMPILRYALNSAMARGARTAPLPVYAPDAPEDAVPLIAEGAFQHHALSGGLTADFGGLRVTFFPVAHPVPSFAMRFALGGRVLCYSGDSTPCDALIEAARGADLFICDAAFLDAELTQTRPHCSARQAAEIAARAGVGQLVLTHFAPGAPLKELLREARGYFPNVRLAEAGAVYAIT